MSKSVLLLGVCACLMVTVPALAAPKPAITGDYVEIRSCDVYTGPCFANGEMNLTGDEAVLAWSVREGQWQGTNLDGLKVLAVVKAQNTLGDVHRDPRPARSVVIVDAKGDSRQKSALVEFARHMGGHLLDHVVQIETAPVEVLTNPSTCKSSGCSLVTAGGLVEIQTRCLGGDDHVCGNEECYYPPLTKIDSARPAYTVVGLFQGKGLGVTFDDAGRRSAYLGTFAQ